MRILVVTGSVWDDTNCDGNTLSNMFDGINAEFANISCKLAKPNNPICNIYYQMSDREALNSFLTRKPFGRVKHYSFAEMENSPRTVKHNNNLISFGRNFYNILLLIRDFVWIQSNWKNDNLKKFLEDFNPDIIYAPCYGTGFMLRLTRYLGDYTGKPIISEISDDGYTMHQFSLSPFFWLNRILNRRQHRLTFPYYSLVYTMTNTQKEQCESEFGANMKILRKSASINSIPEKKIFGSPIRMVYAGGIYLNRWKTLDHLAKALREINQKGVRAVLDIYTGNELSNEINKSLNDGVNTRIHSSVDYKQLLEIYHTSDIALHVEPFDLKNRLAVRMSFSTKIVDCLGSGCAVMAICDSKQGGYRYLEDNDAAICISDLKMIKSKLQEIIDNPEKILLYAAKARQLCIRNHDADRIHAMIKKDFEDVLDRE